MNAAPVCLAPAGVIALPVAAEFAAHLVTGADGLHLLLSPAAAGGTAHWRLSASLALAELPALPIRVAAACARGGKLVLTGADRTGAAQVLGLSAAGNVAWQCALGAAIPIRWPVPGAGLRTRIAWQDAIGTLDLAQVGPAGLSGRLSHPVGEPPLALAWAGDTCWVAWTEVHCVIVAAIVDADCRRWQWPVAEADALALGAGRNGAYVAWARGATANLQWLEAGTGHLGSPTRFDLGDAAAGTLALQVGSEPLLWAQAARCDEGEAPAWISVLALPNGAPLRLTGRLHSVAWWGERVVTASTTELRWYRRTPASLLGASRP